MKFRFDFEKLSGKKIYLYGAGSLAEDIVLLLRKRDIDIQAAVVDNAFFEQDRYLLNDIPIVRFDDINSDDPFIIAANSNYKRIKSECDKKKIKVCFFPRIAYGGIEKVVSGLDFSVSSAERSQLYDLIADEESRDNLNIFSEILESGDVSKLLCVDVDDYFSNDIFVLREDEVYLDIGSYNGDTIIDFLNACEGSYRKVIAVEANKTNAEKTRQVIDRVRGENSILLYEDVLWDREMKIRFGREEMSCEEECTVGYGEFRETKTLDGYMEQWDKITFIKINFPGANKVLRGGKKIIKRDLPTIACVVGFSKEDMLDVPAFLKSISSNYNIYLRWRLPLLDGLVLYATVRDV